MKLKSVWVVLGFTAMLMSCKEREVRSLSDLFPETEPLTRSEGSKVEDDSLGVVEGLTCDDRYLVVYDLHEGKAYTLFDKGTGAYIARFGTIGQGPDDILAGCYGYLSGGCFSVFDDRTRTVVKYELDSLRDGRTGKAPVRLARYDVADARLSRLIAIDDSTFLGAGVYRSRYQFLLFDKESRVKDCGVDIYNASDDMFNQYTKYLSNQGDLVMQPGKNAFAYSLNFSSNLDIARIEGGKIRLVKSLRLGNPAYKSASDGGELYQSVDMAEDTRIGYINLSATSERVYALYSDNSVYKSGRKSDVVLVFDWEGNAVKKYLLDTDAYYIAVDERGHAMLAVVKNAERGWSIVSYPL